MFLEIAGDFRFVLCGSAGIGHGDGHGKTHYLKDRGRP
jgi:hypothetical protein